MGLHGLEQGYLYLIDNVTTAFELVRLEQHSLVLKFVKTKITGDARCRLLVKDLSSSWQEVK
jgi:hypothetical protein